MPFSKASATGIRTSQVVISRMERQITVWPRFDALECIAHNLRYELSLDGPAGIRVRKKKSWRPKKRDPNEAGRGMWSAMVRKGTPRGR